MYFSRITSDSLLGPKLSAAQPTAPAKVHPEGIPSRQGSQCDDRTPEKPD